MVVVVGWAQVGLAGGETSLHLDVEESVLQTEAFLLRCEIFNAPLVRFQGRAEQSVTFLVRLCKNIQSRCQ